MWEQPPRLSSPAKLGSRSSAPATVGRFTHFPQFAARPYNDHRMDTSRIAALLAPFLDRRADVSAPDRNVVHSGKPRADEPAVLSAHQLQDISTYIDILQRWNARVNLTAIRDPEEIVTRHFGESLFAARHLFPGPTHVGT